MKEINIVWNKVTSYSRIGALILFLGVLPIASFYVGIRVERLRNEQIRLDQSSQHILLQSEHGMCRISDCTIQGLVGGQRLNAGQATSTATSSATISATSSKTSSK